MLFVELAATSADVAATRSRLAKRALIATAIRAAEPDEIALVVTYLSGTLRQRRTGVGWASLTSIPPPAAESTLTVRDVDAAFEGIAALGGQGSAVLRTAAVEALFARATEAEQHLLRGLVFDEIRQGALDSLVQDGLAEAFGVPAKAVQRASMLLGSTASAAERAGPRGVGRAGGGVARGRGARPPDAGGERTRRRRRRREDRPAGRGRHQARRHPGPGAPRRRRDPVYTRSLDDITAAGAGDRRGGCRAAVPATGAGRRGAGRRRRRPAADLPGDRLPHHDQAGHRRRAASALPLSLFCFDLLHVDGRDLLDEPLEERMAVMAAVLPPELLVQRSVVDSADLAGDVFAARSRTASRAWWSRSCGAPYAAGRRDSGWVKLKPRHTFDLAVIAAEWGYGRRVGWLSNLHLAARDPQHR